ncbi:MAG: hypothetical protein PUA90_01310 [bacterium]|nr:hypothetical protein [bacterium]
MKKIKIILIIIIACLGATIIYNKFDVKETDTTEIDKHLAEYTLLNDDNIYVFKNIDEIINIMNNKTGIILFCNPSSNWCQYYLKAIDDIAKSNNIKEIYYNDIKEDRNNNSLKYQKIVSKLYDYLDTDDTNNKRLNMPYLLFIKNGNVVAYDNRFSMVSSEITAEEYWNDPDNVMDFENQINEYIYLLNKEDIAQ